MPVVDPSPWAEFGIAGLFGVFALVLTYLFLGYLSKQADAWRETLKDLAASISGLDDTVKKLNGKT